MTFDRESYNSSSFPWELSLAGKADIKLNQPMLTLEGGTSSVDSRLTAVITTTYQCLVKRVSTQCSRHYVDVYQTDHLTTCFSASGFYDWGYQDLGNITISGFYDFRITIFGIFTISEVYSSCYTPNTSLHMQNCCG